MLLGRVETARQSAPATWSSKNPLYLKRLQPFGRAQLLRTPQIIAALLSKAGWLKPPTEFDAALTGD